MASKLPLEKAKIVLKTYKEENFNAKQALTKVGYGSQTIRKQSGRTIDNAVRTVAQSGDQDAILEYLGTSAAEIAREYMKVVKQDKNYPAKLRAMEPLVRAKGITFNDEQTKIAVPILNITQRGEPSDNPPPNEPLVEPPK